MANSVANYPNTELALGKAVEIINAKYGGNCVDLTDLKDRFIKNGLNIDHVRQQSEMFIHPPVCDDLWVEVAKLAAFSIIAGVACDLFKLATPETPEELSTARDVIRAADDLIRLVSLDEISLNKNFWYLVTLRGIVVEARMSIPDKDEDPCPLEKSNVTVREAFTSFDKAFNAVHDAYVKYSFPPVRT